MPTPEFVLELRKKIGHDLLWLNGVTGCEIKEETGIDAVVTDLVAVTSSSRVITYANGDNTMYMDHSFLCALKPGGNAEPYVGDEESLNVGWFELDDLPEPLWSG